MEKQRLSKILAQYGIASRRASEELIFAGKVKVNSEIVTVPQTLVDPNVDKIEVYNRLLQKKADPFYLMMHKPQGYVCSHNKKLHPKILYDLLPASLPRMFSLGRLDKDSTGLILLTNDGHFAQSVIHPSANIYKEYHVEAGSNITRSHLSTISSGITIDDCFVKPVSVSQTSSTSLIIILKEGKNREIRRLLEKAGLSTLYLKRVRIGGLELSNLKEGCYKFLNADEIKKIFQSISN